MYHTFRNIFNFGFYLNILDKPPSKFILKKNSASYETKQSQSILHLRG